MKYKIYYLIILIFATFFCTKLFSKNQQTYVNKRLVSLLINNYIIRAEVADNPELRTLGLMFRKNIKSNYGMLFKYKNSKNHCMWMKNTLVPLSVAFIDKNYIIINIHQMKPNDETPHCSEKSSKYAIEMKSGWFSDKKITSGHKVYGVDD